jgi:hypothetical protein
MRKFLTVTAAALALGGVTLGAAAPAEARYHGGYHGGYHGHYYRHGGGGTAVAAGILGLAAGAAIASDGYYGGRGYYGYGYGPAYYAPPPPPGYYYGGPPCRTDWRWDGWARRYVRVNYCY